MIETNERIKELRKAIALTQQEFAERLGIKRNTVAQYEIGRNPPTDTVITLIVREFGVNEIWLREGIGEMFKPQSRNEELAVFMDGVLRVDDSDFKKRFIAALSKMSSDEWSALEKLATELAKSEKETEP